MADPALGTASHVRAAIPIPTAAEVSTTQLSQSAAGAAGSSVTDSSTAAGAPTLSGPLETRGGDIATGEPAADDSAAATLTHHQRFRELSLALNLDKQTMARGWALWQLSSEYLCKDDLGALSPWFACVIYVAGHKAFATADDLRTIGGSTAGTCVSMSGLLRLADLSYVACRDGAYFLFPTPGYHHHFPHPKFSTSSPCPLPMCPYPFPLFAYILFVSVCVSASVSVSMSVRVSVSTSVRVSVLVSLSVRVSISMSVRVSVLVSFVCACVRFSVFVCACVCVSVSVSVCACVCACVVSVSLPVRVNVNVCVYMCVRVC